MQDNKPPALELTLFGSIEIRVHGAPLPRPLARKNLWLLALLTLRQGKPVERDWLIGRLWPDSAQSQALAYLRQSLTELRHALADEAPRLQTPSRPTVVLTLEGAHVDVLTFDAHFLKADPSALRHALELYRGPLMEGCTDEWILHERLLREHAYLNALERLAEDALTRHEVGVAVGYLRRVIALDPLQEGAQRSLMQALVEEGDVTAAMQVYRDLRLYLHRELHSEPDPKTTELYNQMRARSRHQGDYSSARMYYEESLKIWRKLGDNQGIAASLGSLGTMAYTSGDYAMAQTLYEESLKIQRELGDKRSIASLLSGLGAVSGSQGDYEASRHYNEESVRLCEELGDRLGVAWSLGSLGVIAGNQGDYCAAQEIFENSLAVRRDLGDRPGVAWSLDNLGAVACALRNYESARTLYEESLALRRDLGDRQGIAGSLYGLANVAYGEGDYVGSLSLHRESLAIKQELGDRVGIGESLEACAQLAVAAEQSERAVTFWAAAVTLRETLGSPLEPAVRTDHDHSLNELRESLPDQIFAEAWAKGCALTLDQAVALALKHEVSSA